MKQYMCWIYKVTTTTTSKLPPYWVIQGLTMANKVAKTYSISPAFVVNRDQTKVHLVPNGGKRTWEPNMCKC
jgi:hypothetical protein